MSVLKSTLGETTILRGLPDVWKICAHLALAEVGARVVVVVMVIIEVSVLVIVNELWCWWWR